MANFIRTTSKETADKLMKEGFTLISENNGSWQFLNDNNKNVSFSELKNVVRTDKVFI